MLRDTGTLLTMIVTQATTHVHHTPIGEVNTVVTNPKEEIALTSYLNVFSQEVTLTLLEENAEATHVESKKSEHGISVLAYVRPSVGNVYVVISNHHQAAFKLVMSLSTMLVHATVELHMLLLSLKEVQTPKLLVTPV
jgi:hypothetical protein